MTAVADQTSDTPQSELSTPSVPLEGEALEKALLQQFEFYFSPENLDKDTYLQSQMNAQSYVPIDVIMNFRKVVSLTTDKDLVVKVMSECKNCVLDENQSMVRPNKRGRTTLILRDIADSVPADDIKGIFQIAGCPQPVKVRSDIGDTWFVQFNTEAECQDAMLAVMGATFQGNRLRCGVKSEHVVRAYAPINRVPPSAMGPVPYPQEYAPGYQPFNPYLVGPYNHWQQQQNPYGDPNFDPSRKGRTNQPRTGKSKDKTFGANKTKRKGKDGQETPRKGEVQELKLGLDNFPALPTPVKQQHKAVKYDREMMAAIAKHVSTTEYPCPMPAGDNSAVLSAKPLTESQLLEPMPVIYPASPSPMLAAQPHHSSQLPVLDLNLPFLEYAEMPDPETPEEAPASDAKDSPVTVHVAKPRGSKSGKSRRKSETEDAKIAPPKEEKKAEKPAPSATKTPQVKAVAPVKSGGTSPSKQTYADLLKKK